MALGPMVRQLLPEKAELAAARLYRRIFVDLAKVAVVLADALPENACLLDIGGGDGDLLNHLLFARADISVDMVDIAPSVGRFLDVRHRSRVRFFPSTSIEEHFKSQGKRYTAVLVSDVMHHIPVAARGQFLQFLERLLDEHGQILVKDVEPGHWIASLGMFCDRYISGDRGVKLIASSEVMNLMSSVLSRHSSGEAGLYALDRPNYLVRAVF